MGSDYIICSRVCFCRGITVKSENWRALITVGLPDRTRALAGGWMWKWNEERSAGGWVSRRELGWTVKKDEGGRGALGESLARPREGEANRRSCWTPPCNLFPFASASRTNVGSTGGYPRALHAPMNQSYTATTVFHPRTTLGRAAKILRKSQIVINHAGAFMQQVKQSRNKIFLM